MAGVNKVIIVGNLGKDPEVRTTDSGKKVASISVATSYKVGEKETTEWHKIVVWEKGAELWEKYLKKGDKIYIEGRLSTRSYDKDGVKMYMTEIIAEKFEFLGKSSGPKESPVTEAQSKEDTSDDLPF